MLKDYTPAHKGEKKLRSKYRGPMRIIKAMATSLVVVPWTETLSDIGELDLPAENSKNATKVPRVIAQSIMSWSPSKTANHTMDL
jgi:hypothetical protein